MEISINDQISQPGPDDQVPPTKEPGDDNQTEPLNPTKESIREEKLYITVARVSLNVNIARLWVKLFKRIREPMVLSLRTIETYSLTEPKTAPLTVLTSNISPGSDDDKTLAAQQRVQSCHLFIQQTLRNDGLLTPAVPRRIFDDLTGTEVPLWERLSSKIYDLKMTTARNHFAHNFCIPAENRPRNALPDPWEDNVIFQWVQNRYAHLEPMITTLLAKLEDAIDDKEAWKDLPDDYLHHTNEPSYRQDEEDVEPIWLKYLKEEGEKLRAIAEENERLRKEHGPSWEEQVKWTMPSEEVIFESGFEEERVKRLEDTILAIVDQVKATVGTVVKEALEKVINKAQRDSATDARAATIVQDARNAIIKTVSDTITLSAIHHIPNALESTISNETNS